MSDPACARCGKRACRQSHDEARPPAGCPMTEPTLEPALASARARYSEPGVQRVAVAAARTESGGYGRQTRVEETMAFARHLGAEHLGLAFCVGLAQEARVLVEVLEHHGFRVSSVCCKCGAVPKEEQGLEDADKLRPGQHESACNPVGQARVLAAAGTQLNLLLGLCVGHDTLFLMHGAAPATVVGVKDRVLVHNPVAALYQSRAYYKRLLGG